MNRSLPARTCKVVWVMLMAVAFLSASPAFATIWTVTSTGDSATDTTTLRGAINAAASGDFIDLSQVTGTIVLTLGEVGISKQLTISGPGASQLAISGNNTSRVFHFQAGAASSDIQGLTIENGNGNIDSTHPDNNGGAIRVFEGPVFITSCVFTDNSATLYGGAIYVFNDMSMDIGASTFSNNSASYGGAVYFAGGTAGSGSGGNTGETIFTENYASIAGGAIYYNVGTYDFNVNTVSGNRAGTSTAEGSGGGMYIVGSGAEVFMQHNIFSGNSIVPTTDTSQPGGSAITNLGFVIMVYNTVSGNTGNAASIWNAGDLYMGNVTLAGNDTALYNSPFSVMLVDFSTVALNSVNGIVNAAGTAGGYVNLQNTILAKNSSGNCVDSGSFFSLGFNLSDDTTCEGLLTASGDLPPLSSAGLDPAGLKDNGGVRNNSGLTTDTIALEPGSAAVNAIPAPADCSASTYIPSYPYPNVDQREISRPQGTGCDIGAYEATPDFYFSAVSTITANVGGAGSAGVPVNSFVEFSAPVDLAASPATSGLTASFSANPVTPPSDGSVSPTLTVNVGPSVTPGSYSFSVTGVSGVLNHSVQVNVSVQATAASITQVVADARVLGCIDNGGISNALSSKLAAAQASINAGNIRDAMDNLNAFMNQLHAQAGKHISTSCTDGQGNGFNPVEVLATDVGALQANL